MFKPILFGAALVISPLLALAGNSKTSQKTVEPQGVVFVEEDVAVDIHALPQAFLQDARTDFSNRNFGEAASDLRAASRVYQAEYNGMKSDQGKGTLRDASDRLKTIAQDVSSNKITSDQALAQQLAQVLSLSASSDQQQANALWQRREYKGAGYDLQRAATELETASKWSGHTMDRTAMNTLADIRKTADKLINGSEWTQQEVQTAFNNLDTTSRRVQSDVTANQGSVSGTTRSSTY